MKITRNFYMLFALTVWALPFAGCGGESLPPGMPKPVPCEVTVIQEGKPLEGAVVRLHSEDAANSEWTAVGRTDASGKAVIYTLDRYKGAVPGKYKVIVSKTETEAPDPALASLSSVEAQDQDTSLASFYLVAVEHGMASTTKLAIEVSKDMPTHEVDVGQAVRIKMDERRQ